MADCKEECSSKVISLGRSGNCGPCNKKGSIPVGKTWWQFIVRSKEVNNNEIKKFSDLLVERFGIRNKEAGEKYTDDEVKEVMDQIFADRKNNPSDTQIIDFIDFRPDPIYTNEGEWVYYKGGVRTVLRNFGSVEKIQVALCTDPECKDPACLNFQAEMKEKAAREGLKLL